ncbi:MAG: tRNA (adenosine(37)-N6)-dimethylallyltransferase MiaA [Candidatus Zophobacter franzmannii]|nr:tRNA (adenosine(37)-N6)-dimethylallyltransferase MiaA [Candidatus Zophobacter franzmannii]
MIPIVTIEGTTASGKSHLAIELAKRLNTEIISADSRQIYKFMNIGTAKPTLMDIEKVPHHLINIVFPDARYNAGDFAHDAGLIAHRLHKKNQIPIIAGGTGFYIKALIEGLFQSPDVPIELKDKLENDMNQKGLEAMYVYLKDVDPVAAVNISPQDKQRILRALEVFEYTEKPISVHWEEQNSSPDFLPYRILITDDRENIYNRINNRFDAMLETGLLNEIQDLLNRGYKPEDYGMTAVGYREFMPYFFAETPLLECVNKAKQNSRKYAKRQVTWYRKQCFDLAVRPEELTDTFLNNLAEKLSTLKGDDQ